MGAHLQHLLGRRLQLHARVSADAAEGRGRPHCQHEQRQRLLWASIGPRIPHTAYSAAKFAVKGFTEALITDLRINAPHIKCSVVMPGQIGTSIRANTRKIHSGDRESNAIDAAGLAQARKRFALLGRDVSQLSDDQVRNLVAELERRFRDEALTSAAQAATIILDGVKALNGTI